MALGSRPVIDLRGSSTSALTDSRQFVVLNDRPSTPYTPSRGNVRVSSRPAARLPAADWFRSSNSPFERTEGLVSPTVCRRTGGADATACSCLARWLTTFSRCATTPLHQGPVPEGLPDGRAEPLAAIEDHQHALGEVEAPLDQRPQERRQHRRVLRVRFDEAEKALLPRQRRMPSAMTIVASAERLAVQETASGQVPLLERPSCAALAWMKPRDTVELGSPRESPRRRLVVEAGDTTLRLIQSHVPIARIAS